jgi:hypothetical protein
MKELLQGFGNSALLRFLGLGKPSLDQDEKRLEERKNRIRECLEHCAVRYESVKILLDSSKFQDAFVLERMLLFDLMRLAALIYNLDEETPMADAVGFIKMLPNKKVSALSDDLLALNGAWNSTVEARLRRKLAHKTEKNLCRLFSELEKSHKQIIRKEMRTGLDDYKRKVKYRVATLCLILMAFFSLQWAITYWMKARKLKETEKNMIEIAKIAYEAKKANQKSLVQITGAACSLCFCKKKGNLKDLSDDDPCVQRWKTTISKICEANGSISNVPEAFFRDSWGSPYALDENEREFGKGDSRNDELFSAGPDGLLRTKDDITIKIQNAFFKDS